MHEGPNSDQAFLDGFGVGFGEDDFIVKRVFQFIADFAQFDVVPGAVDGASFRDEGIEDSAIHAFAAAWHKIGVGGGDAFAIFVHRCPVLGQVLVPFGAGDGVSSAGAGAVSHDGAVEVAGVVVIALSASGVEFQGQIAGEDLFAPERSQAGRCFADHVRPAGRALETIDDLPVAAIRQPHVRRFVEEFINDIVPRDFAFGHVGQGEILSQDARAEFFEDGVNALAEDDFLIGFDPEDGSLVMDDVWGRRTVDDGQVSGHGGWALLGEGGGKGDFAVSDRDDDRAGLVAISNS